MKKLLLVLAVVLFAHVVKAEGFGIHIGPKIGYQTSVLSLNKADIKSGFDEHLTAGIFGRFTIHNFIIQPELLWFKSGQIYKVKGTEFWDVNPRIEFDQQNLAVPIFLGYQFVDFKLLKVRANVGPVMYFTLDQKKSASNHVSDVKADVNNVTWGGALSVGVDVLWFTLDISYSFALTNIIEKAGFQYDDITDPTTGEPMNFKLDSTKQNIFTVTLGFKLISLGL